LIRQDFPVGAKFSDPAQRLRSKLRQALLVWASPRIVAILMALAIPGGMQDVLHASEMRALRDIQTITACQTLYLSQFGKYATSLAELGPPGNDVLPGLQAADLIPSSLASGHKDGYLFTVAATQSGYSIHAEPLVFAKTAARSFFSDQSTIIRQNKGTQPATADSPEYQ
jgi:type IV pilus assembly protein PilA